MRSTTRLLMAVLVCQVFSGAAVCRLALAQDLSQEALAAKQRLREKQLAASAKYIRDLTDTWKWHDCAASVSHLFGMEFDDDVVGPLIASTDQPATAEYHDLIWHAIAYTRTSAGRRFLEQKRKSGSPAERKLADACLAAVQLRELGAQCDLTSKGVVVHVYFPHVMRPVPAEEVALVARLPAVKGLSLSNLADGACTPLRDVTTLESVGLSCKSPYIDEAIACLANSKKISMLIIGGPVTDQAMPTLGSFTGLVGLRMANSKITDNGLRHFESLKSLKILELSGTAVTDAGLKHLAGLTELTHLELADTQVRGDGLPHLQNLHKLWALQLSRSQIGDRQLGNFQEFAALRNVKFLYLEQTNITDVGLASLAAMKTAQGFSLDENEKITSAGLLQLQSLKELLWINCPGCHVSDAAAEQFARGRPASFYLTYTNGPKKSTKHQRGFEPTQESPQTKLIKKLRRPTHDGSISQAVIDEVAAGGPQLIAPLLTALKEPQANYHDVDRVLHKMGPDVLDTLIAVLREDNRYEVQSVITRTLALHGMPLLPRLRQWLFDENVHVREAAVRAMFSAPRISRVKLPEEVYIDLLRATDDTSVRVRYDAIEMLSKMHGKFAETSPALTRIATTDKNQNVRFRAIGALGHCAEKLDSDDPLLRKTVETLCVAVEKDESYDVREISVHYLQELAGKDERVLRALVRATSDEVESVRKKAASALKQLGHEALLK